MMNFIAIRSYIPINSCIFLGYRCVNYMVLAEENGFNLLDFILLTLVHTIAPLLFPEKYRFRSVH